jgi:hypothetical protein
MLTVLWKMPVYINLFRMIMSLLCEIILIENICLIADIIEA